MPVRKGVVLPVLQAKLTVNQPGDVYEQEADAIAEQVMRMSDGGAAANGLMRMPEAIQRKCSHCEEEEEQVQRKCAACEAEEKEEVQRKEAGEGGETVQHKEADGAARAARHKERAGGVPSATPAVHETLRSPGQPLDRSTRSFMQDRFGHDFSNVRIHSDPVANQSARDINALAYTHSNKIAFAPGQFSPQTASGKKLLAHELTHVLQQGGGDKAIRRKADAQAAAGDQAVAGAQAADKKGGRFIAEDGETATEGKMQKSVFLKTLHARISESVDQALKGTPQASTASNYVRAAFVKFANSSPIEIERSLQGYAPLSARAADAETLMQSVLERVRDVVAVWKTTGKTPGLDGAGADLTKSGAAGLPGGASGGGGGAGSDGGTGGAGKGISLKAKSGGGNIKQSPGAVMDSLGQGTPLDGGARSRMESAIGGDFSGVEIHTGQQAANLSSSMNARAFTVGNHVAFNHGEYQPGTLVGDALMAHELAHVVQQRGATEGDAATAADSGGYEQDADLSAAAATASIWGKMGRLPGNLFKKYMPRLKTGLRLQSCGDTVHLCPKGFKWGLAGLPAGIGPVCACVWKCLPSRESDAADTYQGPAFRCDTPGCDDTTYITVDEAYKIEGRKNEGTHVTAGAHMTPLGGQPACGCIPMSIEGVPDGTGVVRPPVLLPSGVEVTDVLGPIAAARQNRYTPPDPEKDRAAEVRPLNEAKGANAPKATGGTAAPGGPAAEQPTVKAPAVSGPTTPSVPPPVVTAPTTAPPTTTPPTAATTPPTAATTPPAAAKTPPTTPPAAPAAAGTARPQPKAIQDDLAKNAPARNVEDQKKLAGDIRNYRQNSGIPRSDEIETPGTPVQGGTVAAVRTNIPTLDKKPFGGASPNAIPEDLKGKPGTTGGSVLTPTSPMAENHGENVALENLRTAIDNGLANKTITRQDLVGRTVSVRVEQEPCSSCGSGIDNPNAPPGPIKQFSLRYPELTIEVRNERTSRSYHIRNGVPVP